MQNSSVLYIEIDEMLEFEGGVELGGLKVDGHSRVLISSRKQVEHKVVTIKDNNDILSKIMPA